MQGHTSARYWPLKSNLGTAIKAETLLPLTLVLHCCWPGNTRAFTRLQGSSSRYVMNWTVCSKGATDFSRGDSGSWQWSTFPVWGLKFIVVLLLLLVDMHRLCWINGSIAFLSQTWPWFFFQWNWVYVRREGKLSGGLHPFPFPLFVLASASGPDDAGVSFCGCV